jgi:hypothetical protein
MICVEYDSNSWRFTVRILEGKHCTPFFQAQIFTEEFLSFQELLNALKSLTSFYYWFLLTFREGFLQDRAFFLKRFQ